MEDAVASLVSDISGTLSQKGSTVALALDIKGAFSSIFPDSIINELLALGAPTRIINFVSFLVSEKHLLFSIDQKDPDISGIGVRQGRVLSPFLFSLALRNIGGVIAEDVRLIMYADDILLYTSHENLEESINRIESAFQQISTWLMDRGLEVSIPKTQFMIFSKEKKILNTNYTIKLTDQKLSWHPHIDYIILRVATANNVSRTISRVNWGSSPPPYLSARSNRGHC